MRSGLPSSVIVVDGPSMSLAEMLFPGETVGPSFSSSVSGGLFIGTLVPLKDFNRRVGDIGMYSLCILGCGDTVRELLKDSCEFIG